MKPLSLLVFVFLSAGALAHDQATLAQAEQDGRSLSAGGYHTCGISMDGMLTCFGDDSENQSKDFPEGVRFKAISAGRYHTCGIKMNGTLTCFGGDLVDQRKDFPEGVRFKAISAGDYHTCGIAMDDTLTCFGVEGVNQRKDFPEGVRFKAISAGSYHICGITMDGTLTCFGDDSRNQRKDFPEGVRFKAISAGGYHTCGITMDDTLTCFGADLDNQRDGLENFQLFPALGFSTFDRGLLKLSRYVYPEKVPFVKSFAEIASAYQLPPGNESPLSTALAYQTASARLLAFNYLKPFLSDVQTEMFESKILPKYRSDLSTWNTKAGIRVITEIPCSKKQFDVSLDILIASLDACKPLVADQKALEDLSELLTELGRIKALGANNSPAVASLLFAHANLLQALLDNPATRGFAGVANEIHTYMKAQR
jgi:hypothetical protein